MGRCGVLTSSRTPSPSAASAAATWVRVRVSNPNPSQALLALLEPDALSGSRDEASDAGAHSEAGRVPGAVPGDVTDATGDGAPVAGAPPPQGVSSQRNSTL